MFNNMAFCNKKKDETKRIKAKYEEITSPKITGMIVFCKRLRNFYYWHNEWLCISLINKKCEDVIHEYYRICNDMKYLERVDLLNREIKKGKS